MTRHLNNGLSKIFLLSALLFAVSIACSLPQKIRPARPTEIPVSTASAKELEDNMKEALKKYEETGKLDIQLSESQINSYITLQLKNQPSPIFQNPQIRLQDGEIQLSADVIQNKLAIPLNAKIAVFADESGHLVYEIKSASLGPLPLPDSLTDQVKSQIDQVINVNFSNQLSAIFIQEISIADGIMELHGTAR